MLIKVRNGDIAGIATEKHVMLAIKKFGPRSVLGHAIETVMTSDSVRSDMETTYAMT